MRTKKHRRAPNENLTHRRDSRDDPAGIVLYCEGERGLVLGKQRLDALMAQKGLAESRSQAQALIMAGRVLVGDKTVLKAGTAVSEDAEIRVTAPPPFVSRGGIKLDYALREFNVDVQGIVAADIGASTGGFTDCLLKHGASRVYAIDVGHGQLDYRLRHDPRVVVMEGVNARFPTALPEPVDLATMDLSFISLEKVIPAVLQNLKETGCVIALFKPQFEARVEEVGKGGIIKDPIVQARGLGRFIRWLTESNLRLKRLVASPIMGAEGNREFLLLIGRA